MALSPEKYSISTPFAGSPRASQRQSIRSDSWWPAASVLGSTSRSQDSTAPSEESEDDWEVQDPDTVDRAELLARRRASALALLLAEKEALARKEAALVVSRAVSHEDGLSDVSTRAEDSEREQQIEEFRRAWHKEMVAQAPPPIAGAAPEVATLAAKAAPAAAEAVAEVRTPLEDEEGFDEGAEHWMGLAWQFVCRR